MSGLRNIQDEASEEEGEDDRRPAGRGKPAELASGPAQDSLDWIGVWGGTLKLYLEIDCMYIDVYVYSFIYLAIQYTTAQASALFS